MDGNSPVIVTAAITAEGLPYWVGGAGESADKKHFTSKITHSIRMVKAATRKIQIIFLKFFSAVLALVRPPTFRC